MLNIEQGHSPRVTIRTRLINRRYRLERRIALTDTTETWLGFDNVLHRAVSVSVPRQEMVRNAQFLVEFLQRSRIATALHHRGIVAAFDSGEDDGTPYLVTEYVGGEPLTDIIRTEAPFDVDDVSILVEQVAAALDYAHQRGFVHGGLTASQVVVDGQGATKLLGLGVPTGSMTWHAEPITRTAITFDDDVQALAAIAFEMLTGEEPDPVVSELADAAYLIDPEVPRNASDIVSVGLGAGPARFSSAGAFARSLSDWRTFDPGEYYVAPESVVEPAERRFGLEQTPAAITPSAEMDALLFPDESLDLPAESEASEPHSSRGVRMALVAALLLGLLAAIVVWQGSEATTGPSTVIPAQLEVLAELSGF